MLNVQTVVQSPGRFGTVDENGTTPAALSDPGAAQAGQHGRKQGQARRDEIRAAVLGNVQRRLRAGETFSELNVADIARDAGVSRSTFYAYFVDKTNLLRTWYAEFTRGSLAAAWEWWSLDGTATREDLKRALGRIMDAQLSHPELLAATHEAIGVDEAVREAVVSAMNQYIDGTRVHIETGQRHGFIDPSLLPAETAYWLQWMAERGIHMMARRGPSTDTSQMAQAYTGIVWNTLYAPMR